MLGLSIFLIVLVVLMTMDNTKEVAKPPARKSSRFKTHQKLSIASAIIKILTH